MDVMCRVIVGLTHSTSRAELCRAVLEAAAHQTCEVLEAMSIDTTQHMSSGGSAGLSVSVLKVDGGMSASDVMLQAQADVLGVSVSRAEQAEATAAGAAYAAGLAVGVWANEQEMVVGVDGGEGMGCDALCFLSFGFDAAQRCVAC